jgi:hypothetical protein
MASPYGRGLDVVDELRRRGRDEDANDLEASCRVAWHLARARTQSAYKVAGMIELAAGISDPDIAKALETARREYKTEDAYLARFAERVEELERELRVAD